MVSMWYYSNTRHHGGRALSTWLREIAYCCSGTLFIHHHISQECRWSWFPGKRLVYIQPPTQNISAVLVNIYMIVVIHIWSHEFCIRQTKPVHSNSIALFYVETPILNQELRLNIHAKSVRGMFVQIRMSSYVLIAKPGRIQNVSTGFVTGVVCHLITLLT